MNGTQRTVFKAMGAFVGAAVGDALGAPFEFKHAGLYTQTFPAKVVGGIGEMIGGGSFGWEPGEFTDDTQMALVLAESLIQHRGFQPEDVWKRFVTWADTASDVGTITRTALCGASWQVAAESAHRAIGRSAGNGGLMRAFPIALAYLDVDTETAMRAARGQAALTHFDQAAQWGAAIGVEVIRQLIHGTGFEAAVQHAMTPVPADIREVFADMMDVDWGAVNQKGVGSGPEGQIDAHGGVYVRKPELRGLGNGTVWGCLAQALWAVRTTGSFEDALVAAVNLGDDTDTVACVAGAIAGARYGLQTMPSRWTTYVHGHVATPDGDRQYDFGSLQDMARQLIGLHRVTLTPPEPAFSAMEIAPGLHAANLLGAAETPSDWAVVSLCRHDRLFRHHPVRREMVLLDEEGDANPDLRAVVTDIVDTLDAFLAEGRNVVVHCHGGRSRTALALKAWKMRKDGVSEAEAHVWLLARWPLYAAYNGTFREILKGR
jgi:ADP-ribosyl-[dinitrogen reductase] hydrolase